ncbi:hypothetical protein [Polaromonas sp. AER18D-145]|nr:hypothetical protein [Polaromonas sp. AER18D-145]
MPGPCGPGLGVSVPVGWDELDRLSAPAHRTAAKAGKTGAAV